MRSGGHWGPSWPFVAAARRRNWPRRSALCVLLALVVVTAGSCAGDASRSSVRRRLELFAGSLSRSHLPAALVAGPLLAGTYQSTRFAHGVTLTVDDGWQLDYDAAAELTLTRGPLTAETQTLRFVLLDRAWQVEPPFAADGETISHLIARSRRATVNYVEFVRTLSSYVSVTAADDVSVGGVRASAVEYTVHDTPASPGETCNIEPGRCFAPPSGVRFDVWFIPKGSVMRVAVAPSRAGPILVEASAPDAERLAEMLPSVDAILASLRVDR